MARRPTTLADTLRPAFEGIGGIDVELPLDGAEIELEDIGPEMVDGAEFTELDDGGVEIDFDPENDAPEEAAFDANLALYIKDMDLNTLYGCLSGTAKHVGTSFSDPSHVADCFDMIYTTLHWFHHDTVPYLTNVAWKSECYRNSDRGEYCRGDHR